MLSVRLATTEDAVDMAPRLREADLKEIRAGGLTADPVEALLAGINCPDPCYVAVDEEDKPQIIFGTNPSDEPFLGYVWMMATDAIQGNWVQVLRETRPWINRIKGDYRVLANAVHAENAVHIRWLRWAGFTFLREFEFRGSRFYEFAKLIPPEVP